MPKPSERIFLLDTHVWVWLLNGEDALKSSKALPLIERAVRHAGIRVSAISVWEVAMLEAKGRIHFPINCLDWVQKALAAPGTSMVPLSPEIAVESTRLPGYFHGDPADRILIATARKCKATLITQDKNILAYGGKNFVELLAV